jgi:hypothetical protein
MARLKKLELFIHFSFHFRPIEDLDLFTNLCPSSILNLFFFPPSFPFDNNHLDTRSSTPPPLFTTQSLHTRSFSVSGTMPSRHRRQRAPATRDRDPQRLRGTPTK